MKRIYIGLILLGWVIISLLWVQNQSLRTNLDRAEQNIMAITEDKTNEAIAFQLSYQTLRTKYDSLAEVAGANKHTKEIVRVQQTIRLTDTVLIDVPDTVLVKDFSLDTCLQNDWRTACIRIEPSEGVLRLSDSISVKSGINFRVDSEKRCKRSYRSWFGRKVWGPIFGKKVKVDVVHVQTDNPLIEIEGTDYYQIVR